jgi:hypothetical protein
MLKNFLNLNGVTVLNKEEQCNVNGGQTCRFTIIMASGSRFTVEGEVGVEGPGGSAQANTVCVNHIQNHPEDRCFYDCEHDGFGQ